MEVFSRFRRWASVAIFLAPAILVGTLVSQNWTERGQKIERSDVVPANVTLQQLELLRRSRASIARLRVLCWVLTSPTTIKEKGGAVFATWGKKCDKLLFMTSAQDNSVLEGRVSLPGVTEGRKGLVRKSQKAWNYVYEHYRDQYDWFYKCDDDTYTVVENLKYMLSLVDTRKPTLLGKHLTEDGVHWVSGGAGYVMNLPALRLLKEQIDKKCMLDPKRPHEDMLVSLCLKKAGVSISNSLDHENKSRFMPLTPELHSAPGAIAKSPYKWVISTSADRQAENDGPRCCSDLAVAFHYITPQAQYALDYLVYDLHPYGTRLSDLQHSR